MSHRHRPSDLRPTPPIPPSRWQRWTRHRRTPAVLAVLTVVLLTSGVTILARMHDYRTSADDNAARALAQINTHLTSTPPTPAVSGTTQQSPAACTAPPPSAPTPPLTARAVLNIDTLGMTVPVMAGTDDVTLDHGVGHLDTSAWPDQGGTGVLEAHDVTFFSHLSDLRAGDTVTVTAPCREWTYTVESGKVVQAGDPVSNDAEPTLVLITCWPSNALFHTNQRYVVTTRLASVVSTATAALPTGPVLEAAAAALPPELAAQSLTSSSGGVPMGTLTLTDPADPTGLKSQGGLDAAHQAVRLLVGSERAAQAGRADWLTVMAPGLPASTFDVLADPRWSGRVNVTVTADAGHLQNVRLDGAITINGAARPFTFTVTNRNGSVTVTAVTVG